MSIQVIVSMDWEGTSLEADNLEHIKSFKMKWDMPLVHYYNPAYYTHPQWNRRAINKKVKSVFAHNDEIGLHLHTPRHFTQAAGVTPRLGPCFSHWGDCNRGDFNGQEVMLLAYSKEEIKKLLNHSLEIFNKQGIKDLNSFRAGGWMSDEKVWEALIETGFPIESSATNPHYLNGSSWEGDNLQRYISLIWGEINHQTRPYYLQTYSGPLYEVPNNLGAIDYWKDDLINQHVDEIVQGYEQCEDLVLVINSHQETFKQHHYKLDGFLSQLQNVFGAQSIDFVTNKDVYSKELIYCS